MKKFIVVGSKSAITYKDVFPLLKDGKVMLGINNITTFQAPDGSLRKFGNIGWFTSLKCEKKGSLVLTKTYNEADYPKYDNYDAIEVSKLKDIPYDYEGVMGVPITFFDKWDGEGFEVIGVNIGETKGYGFVNGDNGRCFHIDGNRCFNRILIKKKVEFEVIGLAADKRYDEPWNIMGKPTYVDEQHKGYEGLVIDSKPTYARILIKRKK